MRATINFEVDVDRVQQTMGALVREELHPLRQVIVTLEASKPQDLHDGISKALDILGTVANQLEQYRDMITSFEKARFETILPQTAEPVGPSTASLLHAVQGAKGTVATMKKFDDFLQKVTEEDPDDSEPKER